MDIKLLAARAEKMITDNSPVILTAIGATGTVATAVLTGKAAFKACDVVRDYEHEIREGQRAALIPNFSFKEKVQVTWKFYIPPAVVGTTTVAAIIFANQIGMRRAAAIAAAYRISEASFNEYREKVVEKVGESKERKVREEIQQDRVDASPLGPREIVIMGEGKVLCFESYTSRYFESSMEDIRKAVNDINFKLNREDSASLTDFYNLIGLGKTSLSDDLGWSSDRPLEVEFTTTLSAEQTPCLAVSYRVEPVRDFWRFR